MKFSTIKIAVVFLFILSGICGLVYEVAWAKYLALFIGSTGYSHMMVLATYMGGLALGAFYWGKYSDKVSNQLRLYGILEIAIGVYCLAYHFIIGVAGDVFIHSSSSFVGAANKGGLLVLKFILSFITLILPTFLMGGTLPILTRFVSKKISDSGKDVAVLYFINSFGAVIGTGLAGFFLIRKFGVETTVWIAAFFNILIGLAALAISKSVKKSVQKKALAVVKEDSSQQIYSNSAIRIAVYTALAAGFIAMLYELAWIRLLSNILGSTTYSFTLMLIAFISGIALGSLIVSFVIKRIKNLVAFLAFCQLGTAFSMIIMLPLYERLPWFLMKLSAKIPNQPENFSTFLTLEFLLCFAIMVLPTIFSGMSLPVASRIANRDLRFSGKSIGGIFSVNTFGTVAGALLTGLVLIPLLGVKITLELGVLLNGLFGIFISFKAKVSKQLKLALTIIFIVFDIGYKALFPAWNQNFLISGVFRTLYTQGVPSYREFENQQNEGQKTIWYKEGINANVAVRESYFAGTLQKTLVINGKADASSIADLNTQVLLGQLPLMLFPNNGNALVIGLGTGITCGSALCHPVQSLDVVEISSEVVECNSFFTQENNKFMADPRVKIYIDDAITFLKISKKKYDYIISEPSNPWIAGIGNLYSVEFFELCKERLNTNGMLTQWFHTYDVNNDIFKLVMGTIAEVFPYVSIWKASDADILILASANPLSIDFDAMEQKMICPSIARDLTRIKMFDVPALLSTQVVSARNNPFALLKNDLNTARKPLLEFLAPVALFTHATVSILDSLDERFSFQDKNLWFSEYEKQHPLTFENYMNIARYRSDLHTGDLAIAYSALRKALELSPENEEVLTMIAKTTTLLGLPDVNFRQSQHEELRLMYELNPDDSSAVLGYMNALVECYRIDNSIVNPRRMDEAVELMRKSIQNNTGNGNQYRYILAMVLTGAGRYEEAAGAFDDLIQTMRTGGAGEPTLPKNELVFNMVESYYNSGNLTDAEKYLHLLQYEEPENGNYQLLQKKIAWKRSGYK